MDIESLVKKARKSKAGMWLLNLTLSKVIPFNKPHGLAVMEISDHSVEVKLPYKKSNLNHIQGLHACAMATAAEFTSGLLLLYRLGTKDYRIIMESLEMQYHYQGKSDALAKFSIEEDFLETKIIGPLKEQDAVVITCEVPLYDADNNHLCTGKVNWQLKKWDKVRTKK